MVLEGKILAWIALLLAGRGGAEPEQPSPSPRPFPPSPQPSPNVIPIEPTLPQGPAVAPPWPIQPPADLPAFPSAAWEYDEPPSGAVVQRAGQLVPVLYGPGKGLGSYVREFIGGAWHAFKAERMRNGKNGVTAWRLRGGRFIGPPSPGPVPGPARPVQPSPAAEPPFIPAGPFAPPVAPGGFSPPMVVVPRNPAAEGMGVRDAQDALNQLGYGPLVVDGKIGPKTRDAVSRFQRANPPLVVDGIVGPQTKSILMARLAALHGSPVVVTPAAPAQPGITSAVATIADVQRALNALGFGPVSTDGIWGPKTSAAVRSFQKAKGLVVDGIAGPRTKAALSSAVQAAPA